MGLIMGRKKWFIIIMLVAVIIGLAYREFFSGSTRSATASHAVQKPSLSQADIEAKNYADEGAIDEMEGVNLTLFDEPVMQRKWMARGKAIAVNNYPGADDANFKSTFFHRGFKNTAVTCGKVEFLSEGSVIAEYQRFIFAGLQMAYFEKNINNFDILWEKMCKQLNG
jgi:hypothetical protein